MVSRAAEILDERNEERRAQLVAEFGTLRPASADRWLREQRVFGVPYRGQTVFPAFQFDSGGGALPVVGETLKALPTNAMTAWEVAFWWTAPNGGWEKRARST